MTRFPTRRAAVVAGAGTLLILAGVTAQAGWLFVLAAGALGLVGGSLVVRHRLGSVEVERAAPRRVRVGDEVSAGFSLRNRSSSSVPMFVVSDELDAFAPATVGCERLPGNATAHVELVRGALRRGVFAEGRITMTSGAPFGLVRSRRRQVVPVDLTVVPRWVDLRSFPLIDPSAAATDNPEERPMAGAGQEYMGIREYRPGDPLRSVHWRSTARASKLIVREYEREVSARIGIVLAGADHGDGPESSFETLVSAAASIGLHALDAGHSIYVVQPGRDGVERLAEPSPHDLLGWLAALQPVDAPLDAAIDAAHDALGDGATVIVVSSDAGETGSSVAAALRSLRQRGSHALLIVAQSASWDKRHRATFDDVAVAGEHMRVLRADRELETCLAG
ncbi:MAG TPA: DUF58 domain-containing protein [Actinomycetota bacterium]|nr:DUF58 domain-containing protein [Actinomycetota bacterium]